ncbi:RagB/SusD family nutrient uptake outer membrane protein [Chitinophagaceae bacterium LB-8]|uniref:RagB/SusD family nutrient uptake outer membrane protein n=1 Tax=Paraflavisolibacter caeni TaxID=2982496 RepID=A0A9X2XVY8_9BACT|nr:RagB/SusD family nutrient uptake outer membrane protein [Paraflavisolibacter caeni]MCU7549910.1 RagB/SusD family nutrient uptake outer membrane protein [Paraflavisolibacter caeni]
MYKLLKFRSKIAFMVYFMILCLGFTACKPELDFQNVNGLNPDNVWNDKNMINAYLNDIYANSMPGWNFGSDNSDESMSSNGPALSAFCKGININVSGVGVGFSYGNIDKINFMLDKLPTVSSTVLTPTANDQMQGQGLFWRAWHYWNLVKTVGGVPLIRKPQNAADVNSLFVKRSATSKCMDSILADLDKAISILPRRWSSGPDYGRIDKCAALAFKGRILMWYASPLFNTTNDPARWQKAYDACKAAYDTCVVAGYGLFPTYNQIWQTKGTGNTEAIMYNNYYYPDHAYSMNTLMGPGMSQGNACQCMPTVWQLLSFPRKDGTSMEMGTATGVDTARLRTDATYNATVLTDIVKNMDPRFYASVSVPGMPYPSLTLPGGQNFWTAFGYNSSGKLYEMASVQTAGSPGAYSIYGCFYPLKAVTPGTDQVTSQQKGGNNFIEIRFAEVLMNLAECANELNSGGHNYQEALTLLAALRQRGGITKGGGTYGYGLDVYSTQASVRNLMMSERLAEFCQESKRWDNLRRLKRFDILNAKQNLSNLFVVHNTSNAPLTKKTDFDWTQNIQTDAVRANFHLEFKKEVTNNPVNVYNLPNANWFYPIALNDWQKNFASDPAQQNNEWGGTFDPLK